MEWWETSELDGALWREPCLKWAGYRGGKPSAAWIERKFDEYFELKGEYSLGVKEK